MIHINIWSNIISYSSKGVHVFVPYESLNISRRKEGIYKKRRLQTLQRAFGTLLRMLTISFERHQEVFILSHYSEAISLTYNIQKVMKK
jgi:hypothetical protein